jgi:capsular exopolysaccharide synthesis family protein
MELDFSSVEQNEEGLDLRYYFSLILHWWWLIVLAALIAGGASYLISNRMTPYYQSSTTVLVNAAPASKASDYNSVMMSEQLTSTYAQMMSKDAVLNQVAKQVGLSNPPDEIKKWITVTPVRDTQLIQVVVETTDPELSAKIANSIVDVFSIQIQDIQTQRFSQSKSALETQLTDYEKQIDDMTVKISITVTSDEIDRLNEKITQYRGMYSNLLQSYEQIRLSEAQSVSTVVQVESAVANPVPVKPKVMQNSLLAAVVGILLAAGLIFVREAFDDTIKTPDDISRKFKLPVLGVIAHHESAPDSPIALTSPRSPVTEAYRTLRTNLGYTSVDRKLSTIMITSAEPGEGKSTITSNLGVVMAQNGKRVIALDCDLRHPCLHTNFGLTNRQGMSTLLSQTSEATTDICNPTKEKGLYVISTGPIPPNPAEMLGSQRLQSILKWMKDTTDVILIDTPPILAVSDPVILAPSLDGVVLVVKPGKTRYGALKQAIEQLQLVNARILGVVLNDVVTRGKAYGYYYKNYRGYNTYQNYYSGKTSGKKSK